MEFDPPLPREKVRAIEALGMGTENKVVMRFKEVFWDAEQVTRRVKLGTEIQRNLATNVHSPTRRQRQPQGFVATAVDGVGGRGIGGGHGGRGVGGRR